MSTWADYLRHFASDDCGKAAMGQALRFDSAPAAFDIILGGLHGRQRLDCLPGILHFTFLVSIPLRSGRSVAGGHGGEHRSRAKLTQRSRCGRPAIIDCNAKQALTVGFCPIKQGLAPFIRLAGTGPRRSYQTTLIEP